MQYGVGGKTAYWVLLFVAGVGVWLGGCTSVGPSVAGEDVHRADVYYLSDGTYRVTLWGTFGDDDTYEVIGPPENKRYYEDKPINGNLSFLVTMYNGVYRFTVNNTTTGRSLGQVLVTLT